MPKVDIVTVGTLDQPVSAVSAINKNFERIQTAIEITLSRDGTAPNPMQAVFDMNNNDIINTRSLSAETIAVLDLLIRDGRSMVWQGLWDTGVQYGFGDVVVYNNTGFIALESVPPSLPPDSGLPYWEVFVRQGPQGDEGPQGAPGVVQSVIAGDGIETDNSNPAEPIVSVNATPFILSLFDDADAAEVRAGLELVKQSNALDPTADRLLTTGSFGLGTDDSPIITDSNAADTLLKTGFYYLSGPATGLAVATNTLVIGQSAGSGRTTQIASAVTDNRIWTRQRTGGVWGLWTQLFTQDTILGAVSQVGGVPTGAVIESGSNSNGHYTMFADGTLICHFYTVFSSSVARWRYQWVYPVQPVVSGNPLAVVATPDLIASNLTSAERDYVSSAGASVPFSSTQSYVDFYLNPAAGFSPADRTMYGSMILIGRWF